MWPRWFDRAVPRPGTPRGGRRQGSALLEAALALAVLAPLAVLAAQYAWGVYQYQSLHSLVEESARYAASASLREGVEAWRADVQQFALCGAPKPCARPRVPHLLPANVGVELVRGAAGAASVKVSIQGFTLAFPGGSKRFEGSPSAQFPRLDSTPAMDEGFAGR